MDGDGDNYSGEQQINAGANNLYNAQNKPNLGAIAGQIIGYAGGGVNPARLRALEIANQSTGYQSLGPLDPETVVKRAKIFLKFLEGDDA